MNRGQKKIWLDFWILASFLLASFSLWLFLELAGELQEAEVERIDKALLRLLRKGGEPSRSLGPGWLVDVMRDITALGSGVVIFLLAGFAIGYLWIRKTYHAIALILTALLGGWLIGLALKESFDRIRPDPAFHLAVVQTASFPSGHAMLSAISYLTLGGLLARLVGDLRLKAYFVGCAICLTILVGFSRVYLGVHYPSDVLAGWLAGLSWAMICWTIARYLQLRGIVAKDISESSKKNLTSSQSVYP